MNTHINYIIVGGGYAGLFFAHQLIKNNKSFVLFTQRDQSASEVSAGMINPAILKKFTTFWMAQEQIDYLHQSLSEIEHYTGGTYFINHPVHRIFHDQSERDLWLKKSNQENLKPFLNPDFKHSDSIANPFGLGEVMQSGRLDVTSFFKDFFTYLESKNQVVFDEFHYQDLNPDQKTYQDLTFDHVVFCEGIGVKNNPYFSDITVQPNKGHHLIVRLSEPLQEAMTLKKKHFLFHLQDDLYYYGGTYDRIHTDGGIDQDAVDMLSQGLQEFYKAPFEIVDVEYGFRPTVKDRRPILGQHSHYHDFYVFNGLGARGILNGCYFSKELFDYIQFQQPIHPEVSIHRFQDEPIP